LIELKERCKKTLDRVRQEHSGPHPAVSEALADMAFAYHQSCEFKAALDCEKTRLEMEKSLNGEFSTEYVECLVQMARGYLFCGKHSAAETALERADSLVNGLPVDAYPRSTVLLNLALAHERYKDDQRVEELLMQAMKAGLRDFGWADPQYGI